MKRNRLLVVAGLLLLNAVLAIGSAGDLMAEKEKLKGACTTCLGPDGNAVYCCVLCANQSNPACTCTKGADCPN